MIFLCPRSCAATGAARPEPRPGMMAKRYVGSGHDTGTRARDSRSAQPCPERGALAGARRGAAPNRRSRRCAVAAGGKGRRDRRGRSRPGRRPQPVSRPLAQRRGPQVAGRYPRTRRAARIADRSAGHDHRGIGQPIPDDWRPQGAGRIRMPHSAPAVRSVRRDASPCGLALDRQLLSGRCGNRQAAGVPVGRGAAGRHEPGTFRLARGVGGRSGRRSPHAGHGEQRQGESTMPVMCWRGTSRI